MNHRLWLLSHTFTIVRASKGGTLVCLGLQTTTKLPFDGDRVCWVSNPPRWKRGRQGLRSSWAFQQTSTWYKVTHHQKSKKLKHQENATWTFHSKSAICLAPCVLRLPKHSAKPKWPVYYQQTHQTLISLDREISTIFTQPHINLYTKHLTESLERQQTPSTHPIVFLKGVGCSKLHQLPHPVDQKVSQPAWKSMTNVWNFKITGHVS